MFADNSDDVSAVYDYHLLAGHFEELETSPKEIAEKMIREGDAYFNDAKARKGAEKIFLQIYGIIKYSSALALADKCLITDIEGLFSFICVRHPELELDWITLQKIILHSSKKEMEYSDQKTIELAVALYASSIKNCIQKER